LRLASITQLKVWLRKISEKTTNYKKDTITKLGHAQAKALAQKMKNMRIDFLYVSPLGRAQATSSYIADALGINPVTLDWLKEINWDRITDYINRNKFARPDRWSKGFNFKKELKPDYENITNGFNNLLQSHGYSKSGNLYQIDRPSENVLGFVSHGGTISTLLGYLLHWTIPLIHIYTHIYATSITRLYWKKVDERYVIPQLGTFNECFHLKDIPSEKSKDRIKNNSVS
jgi:probable phosphoglycerate mutase